MWSVDKTDAASRLELTMTLILTAVLFDTQSGPKPYLTVLDKYVLACYAYMTLVMFENAGMGFLADGEWCDNDGCLEDVDNLCWYGLVVLFLVKQALFIGYAVQTGRREREKIFMGYEEVKAFNRQFIQEREVFRLYDTGCFIEGPARNKYKRCLVIGGAKWPKRAGNQDD